MDENSVNSQEERELLYRLKEGDHRAFEEIYHLYKDRLIGSMLRMLKSRELVEEQVQELFLRIWNGRDTIDPDKSFKAYLFRIASNMIKNTFRKMAHDKKMRTSLLPVDQQVYSHIEEHIESLENRRILGNLLDKLPPQRRIVFTLCKIEGKSYREVSEMLNISENTVNDHIKKANMALRRMSGNLNITSLQILAYISLLSDF